jgi:hypothetical protein
MQNYDFMLHGLGRFHESDPDDVNSYRPGIFWAEWFYSGDFIPNTADTLLVPMDSRTYASSGGTDDYEFTSSGGLSWSVPWLAGMYALCLQVNPEIEYDEFVRIALETGDIISIQGRNEIEYFGTIINPTKLVDYFDYRY